MPLKVIVVGAGIAGLCTAVSLRQAGCEVKIFEKSAFAGEIGAALALTPNGARVLEHLGFSFERARACPIRTWDTTNGLTLRTLGSVDLSRSKQMFGAQGWTVHRVDLHTELLRLATDTSDGDLAGTPAQLRLSCQVVKASPDGTVVLQDGSRHTADLVVASDGLRSVFRDLVIGEELQNKPTHSGLAAFRFLVETDVLRKDAVLSPLLDTMEGKANIMVDTKETEKERHMMWYACRGGETQNFVGIHPSQKELAQEGEAAKSDMAQEFAHFDDRIAKILKLADHVKCWPLFVHDPYPSWVRGRIVLIGDAAHPMLPFGGQGANMAIEDGGALGFLLQNVTSPSEIDARLAMFESVRRNRVSRVQILSKVRAGREKEVENEVRCYADSPSAPIPTSHQERTVHDYSYDVFGACEKVLQAAS